jgi:hypothetical protein
MHEFCQNMGLGYILGDLFPNASGHPVWRARKKEDIFVAGEK